MTDSERKLLEELRRLKKEASELPFYEGDFRPEWSPANAALLAAARNALPSLLEMIARQEEQIERLRGALREIADPCVCTDASCCARYDEDVAGEALRGNGGEQ